MHSIDRVVRRNAGRKERTQNPQPPNVILGKVPVLPSLVRGSAAVPRFS
jgi:hypothetical protein